MPDAKLMVVSIVVLFLVACGGVTNDIESLPTLSPVIQPSVQELPMPNIASGNVLGSGHLAFIGVDNNIYIVSAGEEQAQRITDNAVPILGGQGREYHDPTWSPNGWLSFVSTELTDNEFLHTIYAVRPSRNPVNVQELYQASDTTYIYGYWSPAQCEEGIFCARFSYMMSHPDEIDLRMAEVHSDRLEVYDERLLGRGQPFYFSWSPDGTRMVWFRAGQTLEIYNLDENQPGYILPDSPGLFQAPAWSPVDDRILFALESDDYGNQIVVADPNSDMRLPLTEGGSGLSAFAWSPDGQWVVAAEAFEPLPNVLDKLTIIAADGQTVIPVAEGEVIVAFFWSPDSKQLAYFTLVITGSQETLSIASDVAQAPPQQTETVIELNVVKLETGESLPISHFFPTRSQIYLFQFFDQFAQSHTVWSPDSSQIVFAELLPDGREFIRVVDTSDPQQSSITIAEGSFAVFSFHD